MERAAWKARPALGAVFVAGAALTFGGMGLGFVVALKTEGSPPRVSLAEQVARDLAGIERRIEAGDVDRALAELEVARGLLFDERARIETLFGRAHRAAGRPDEAVEHLRRAIALAPEAAGAHHELALAYAEEGRLDPAAGELREVLRLDPENGAASHNLAVLEQRLAARATPPATAAESGVETAELAQAREDLGRFYRGELELLRARFSATLAARLSAAGLRELHESVVRQLGAERERLDESVVPRSTGTTYLRRARFDRYSGEVEVVVQLTADRTIEGLQFRPAAPR